MSKRPVRRTLFVQPSHTMSGSILTPITNEEVWKALTTFSMFTQPPTLGIALTEFVEQDVKGRRQECREMVKFLRRDEDYSEKDWLRLSAEFDYILLTMEKEERQVMYWMNAFLLQRAIVYDVAFRMGATSTHTKRHRRTKTLKCENGIWLMHKRWN